MLMGFVAEEETGKIYINGMLPLKGGGHEDVGDVLREGETYYGLPFDELLRADEGVILIEQGKAEILKPGDPRHQRAAPKLQAG